MYQAVKGNIIEIKKKKNSLKESLLLAPTTILIIFFYNLKTSMLCEQFPHNNSPYVITELKYA